MHKRIAHNINPLFMKAIAEAAVFGVTTSKLLWISDARAVTNVRRGQVKLSDLDMFGSPKYKVVEQGQVRGRASYCIPSGRPCSRDCPDEVLEQPVWIGDSGGRTHFSQHRRALYRKDCGPIAGCGVRAVLIGACYSHTMRTQRFVPSLMALTIGLIAIKVCEVGWEHKAIKNSSV